MARLPTPGADNGTWGSVLNDFLSVAHNADGTLKNGVFSVENYGAKGDGTTDDTIAITNAINAAVSSGGGIVWFPAGKTYLTTAPLPVKSGIAYVTPPVLGTSKVTITNAKTDVFRITDQSAYRVFFDGLVIAASGGNVLSDNNFPCSFIFIRNCIWRQYHNNYSVIRTTKQMLDSVLEQNIFQHTLTATVPTLYLQTNIAGLNTMTIKRNRFLYSGNYAVWIENTLGNYCSDNVIKENNFEITYGGAIKLLSCFNTTLFQNSVYDLNYNGKTVADITRSLFYVGKSPTNPQRSVYTKISQCGRRTGGTLAANIYDIELEPGQAPRSKIELCDSITQNSFKINLGNNSSVILESLNAAITVDNASSTTYRIPA